MNERQEEGKPDAGGHDPDDQRGGGGPGGLSGAVPGAEEEPTPEGETSPNEPEADESRHKPDDEQGQ